MSDQATLGEESEREDPSQQGTSYDEKQFVRRLLESCSNRTEETFNFEDYATQKERGLEDLHPKRRQKCYVNREDVLSDFVSKSKYRGRKTAILPKVRTPLVLHIRTPESPEAIPGEGNNEII